MAAWVIFALCVLSLLLAVGPAGLLLSNLARFRRPRLCRGVALLQQGAQPSGSAAHGQSPGLRDAAVGSPELPRVAALIPARDEAATIGDCLAAIRKSIGVDVQVIVLDDHSTDGTAVIVRELAAIDPRIRLESAPPLPAGWCGKQHACQVLASRTDRPWLVFVDADVRLSADAITRAIAFAEQADTPLVSGFPLQETGSCLERLLLPLIHFVLLGYLPIAQMRRSLSPAFGAGCGQWFIARRDAYATAGGHAAIRASLHDGIALPRAFRRAGFRTDIFDATDTAACRMYHSSAETWRGLGKNAIEGLAAPAAIVPWTIVLGLGQVAPPILLVLSAMERASTVRLASMACALVAWLSGFIVRLVAAGRFRQSVMSAALHPLGVLLLLVIQWQALTRHLLGRPATWRGRTYAANSPAAESPAAL